MVIKPVSNGREARPATLVECDNLPGDKGEVPTPQIAQKFPHLQTIANEFPPEDETADVHILLGRDAAELLKARAFKNDPKRALWAQKLLLGWTIFGQVCLNFQNQPVHVETKKNSVGWDVLGKTCKRDVSNSFEVNSEDYCMVPCPNQVQITDGTMGSTIALKPRIARVA